MYEMIVNTFAIIGIIFIGLVIVACFHGAIQAAVENKYKKMYVNEYDSHLKDLENIRDFFFAFSEGMKGTIEYECYGHAANVVDDSIKTLEKNR